MDVSKNEINIKYLQKKKNENIQREKTLRWSKLKKNEKKFIIFFFEFY